MSEIRIVDDYLATMEGRASQVASEFGRLSSLPPSHLASAPTVAAAFRHFTRGWDLHRNALREELDGVATALSGIRTAMRQTDEGLAAELEK